MAELMRGQWKLTEMCHVIKFRFWILDFGFWIDRCQAC